MHFKVRPSRFALLVVLLAASTLALSGALHAAAAAQDLVPGFDAAKGGNGKGGGNPGKGGNGGNGGKGGKGGGKGGKKPGAGMTLAMQPDVWNTNWEHSNGTVSALIRGGDVSKIDLDSIVLVGTDEEAEALEPTRVQRGGGQVRAFFAKDDALATLDTPERGEKHEVAVEFVIVEDDDTETEKTLTDMVRIVGPAGDDEGEDDEEELDLSLAIQPDSWNVNWVRSNGTVSALIRGEGLADIDLATIVLVGTDPEADPLPALRASRQGNHVRAFFAKDDAFDTLDTPRPGEMHEIIIRFTAAEAEEELTDRIRVVGPNR